MQANRIQANEMQTSKCRSRQGAELEMLGEQRSVRVGSSYVRANCQQTSEKQVVAGKIQAGREELSGKDISCRESERNRERKIVDDTVVLTICELMRRGLHYVLFSLEYRACCS